jgi:hypothetical protein
MSRLLYHAPISHAEERHAARRGLPLSNTIAVDYQHRITIMTVPPYHPVHVRPSRCSRVRVSIFARKSSRSQFVASKKHNHKTSTGSKHDTTTSNDSHNTQKIHVPTQDLQDLLPSRPSRPGRRSQTACHTRPSSSSCSSRKNRPKPLESSPAATRRRYRRMPAIGQEDYLYLCICHPNP